MQLKCICTADELKRYCRWKIRENVKIDVFEDKSVVKLESQIKFWAWNWKEDAQVENHNLDRTEKSSKREKEHGQKRREGRKFRQDSDIWRDLVDIQPYRG
jgi:hypothetical protein